jgi:hypothetical protein
MEEVDSEIPYYGLADTTQCIDWQSLDKDEKWKHASNILHCDPELKTGESFDLIKGFTSIFSIWEGFRLFWLFLTLIPQYPANVIIQR